TAFCSGYVFLCMRHIATTEMYPLSLHDALPISMSTLYGSDAMGGVVNIITRKVSKEWGGSATLETRLEQNSDAGDTNKASFYLSGPIVADKLGVSLRGSVLRRGDSSLVFDDGSAVSTRGPSPVGVRSYSVGTKFSFTPNTDHDFWLDLD